MADKIKEVLLEGMSMVQLALRWILDHDAVSVVIPGASSPEQARENAAVSEIPALSPALHQVLADMSRRKIHSQIRGPY